MPWQQIYDPLGSPWLSTLCAAVPVVVLLGGLGVFRLRAHTAALLGLLAALLVASFAFGMPAQMAVRTAVLGALQGLFPIGWIVLNIIFLYRLTEERGLFKVLQESITGITVDRRLQLLLIAFSFGAFFEGAAGFGTPVAVTGAILIGLGFSPLAASGLSLIANTAPVAFGALGTPVITLAQVSGLPVGSLSAMVGRQLPFFSVLVPFWLIAAFAGWRGMKQIWPAILVAGVTFAVPQCLMANLHGPTLVDVVSSVVSIVCLSLFLKIWKPAEIWTSTSGMAASSTEASAAEPSAPRGRRTTGEVMRAWLPWFILSVLVFLWGLPSFKALLDGLWAPALPMAGLDKLVQRVPPVVAKPTVEGAVFKFNILSMTGTGILVSALIGGLLMGYTPAGLLRAYGRTFKAVRYSLLTIAAMLSLGYVTRYSGMDATMGLAFAKTGFLYPFFGTLLGWLGVALTGSDTASNVLFGSLQRISAEQLGLSPILMGAANSSGGVMGKMIDAQSIVVAATATGFVDQEGTILRYVFFHSIALAGLVGLLVMAQAYLPPFTALVVP